MTICRSRTGSLNPGASGRLTAWGSGGRYGSTPSSLFLEEYYTLGLIAHGGIGTSHVDGNTLLCTATAAAALKESFASDGQPGSYTDIDHADVICLFGHNMAETQTVLWTRILDRLAGPNPPKVICVDPRQTPVADAATVHLAPRPGTNVMLMNALLHAILENDWVDHRYVDAPAVGFEELTKMLVRYSVERAAEVCDVPAEDLREAARLIGTSERLLSTVLQGSTSPISPPQPPYRSSTSTSCEACSANPAAASCR